MEWSQTIVEWWSCNATVISLVEFGLLIVGGSVTAVAAWWHHRSLKDQMKAQERSLKDQMKAQERTLLAAIEELTESVRNMEGRPAEEQRRIVAEAEKIAISATASFGPITAISHTEQKTCRHGGRAKRLI